MKSRAVAIAGVGALVVAGLATGTWLMRGRPGADAQTVRVTVSRPTSTPEQNEKDIALELEKTLAKVPRITGQHIAITKFGVTADCRFEPATNKERQENFIATENTYMDGSHRAASVGELPRDAPATWIFATRDLSKELTAVGNLLLDTCGEPPSARIRIVVDGDKLRALLGGDIVDFEKAIGLENGAAPKLEPEELRQRIVRDQVHVGDVATVSREPRPMRCYGFSSEGKSMFAHLVSPLPGLTPDQRAKIDAIAKDAGATIVHDNEVAEARFTVGPEATLDARRRLATDYAVRGKLSAGVDVVGSTVSYDGEGSLIMRKPINLDKVRGLIKENYGTAWGGIRGAHRLEVTITGDDRKALAQRAKEVEQRLSTLEGVGTSLTLPSGSVMGAVFEIDEEAAKARGISVPALQGIASTLQGDSPEASVVLTLPPLGLMTVGGAPASAFIHGKERPITARLFRADQKPAIELAFETEDPKVASRARQALGESADVSLRILPTAF